MNSETCGYTEKRTFSLSGWQKIIPILLFLYALMEFIPIFLGINLALLLVVICTSLFNHLVNKRNLILGKLTAEAYAFLGIWLGYCLLSVLWARNTQLVLDYTVVILHYIPIFVIFSQFFLNENRQQQLVTFYQVITIAYLGLAIWEITTSNHFSTSKYYGVPVPLPTGPFYGENVLAAIWLILIPYFSVPGVISKYWIMKIPILVMTCMIFLLSILLGARIAIMALAFGGFYYLIRWASWTIRVGFILILILVPLYISKAQPQLWRFATTYAEEQINSIYSDTQSATLSSFQIREQLIKEGFSMFITSHLLGVGGGNFEDQMLHGRSVDAGGMSNPHNYWMEILANFGIVIFAGFLYLYVRWLLTLWKLFKKGEPAKRLFYRASFLSLLMFIPASVLPSSIRFNYLLWIYFAGINSICVTGMAYFEKK